MESTTSPVRADAAPKDAGVVPEFRVCTGGRLLRADRGQELGANSDDSVSIRGGPELAARGAARLSKEQ
jgi:hypothetical protein